MKQLRLAKILGPVSVSHGAALRPQILPDEAQCAGLGHFKFKRCNAGWRDLERNPLEYIPTADGHIGAAPYETETGPSIKEQSAPQPAA